MLRTRRNRRLLGDRLHIETVFDPDTLGARLPCLIVQPLVENSIDHGVSTYLADAKVRVEAMIADGRILLSVEDNGVGIDENRLQRINSQISSDNLEKDDQGSIGISNVISRMSIFFNDDISYELTSQIDVGTKIVINFPILRTRPDEL